MEERNGGAGKRGSGRAGGAERVSVWARRRSFVASSARAVRERGGGTRGRRSSLNRVCLKDAREHRKRCGRILKDIKVLRVAHKEDKGLDAARLGDEFPVDRVVEGKVAERRRAIALHVCGGQRAEADERRDAFRHRAESTLVRVTQCKHRDGVCRARQQLLALRRQFSRRRARRGLLRHHLRDRARRRARCGGERINLLELVKVQDVAAVCIEESEERDGVLRLELEAETLEAA